MREKTEQKASSAERSLENLAYMYQLDTIKWLFSSTATIAQCDYVLFYTRKFLFHSFPGSRRNDSNV